MFLVLFSSFFAILCVRLLLQGYQSLNEHTFWLRLDTSLDSFVSGSIIFHIVAINKTLNSLFEKNHFQKLAFFNRNSGVSIKIKRNFIQIGVISSNQPSLFRSEKLFTPFYEDYHFEWFFLSLTTSLILFKIICYTLGFCSN